jgi:membrane protein
MLAKFWTILKQTVMGFIDDDCLSKGAAIAYFTIFSLAPMLVIAVAIAGLVFGNEAASGAVSAQLGGIMGEQGAKAVEAMVAGASNRGSGILATVVGLGTLLLTATGVFGELQSSLNAIWRVETPSGISGLIRARIAGLGMVAALGFLLLTSLVASAAISALGGYATGMLPGGELLLQVVNFAVSFAIVSLLFAAVYKILPSKPISYRDVAVGAVATAFMFTVGKTLIGLYLGSSTIASSYGAAGAFVIVLIWIYYSSLMFLLGAEFTKAWATYHGSEAAEGTDQPATTPIVVSAGAQVEVARNAAASTGTRWIDVVAVAGVLYSVMRSQRRPR